MKEQILMMKKSYDKYTQKVYSCDLMYDEIIKFVERSKDEPFFWHGLLHYRMYRYRLRSDG